MPRITDPSKPGYQQFTLDERLGQIAINISTGTSAEKDSLVNEFLNSNVLKTTPGIDFSQGLNLGVPQDRVSKLETTKIDEADPVVQTALGSVDESGISIFDRVQDTITKGYEALGIVPQLESTQQSGDTKVQAPSKVQDVKQGEAGLKSGLPDKVNQEQFDLNLPGEGIISQIPLIGEYLTKNAQEGSNIGEYLGSGRGNLMLAEIAMALSQPGSPNAKVAEVLIGQAKAKAFSEGDLGLLSPQERLQLASQTTSEQLQEIEASKVLTDMNEVTTQRSQDEITADADAERQVEIDQAKAVTKGQLDAEADKRDAESKNYFAGQTRLRELELQNNKYQYEAAIRGGENAVKAESDRIKRVETQIKDFSNSIWNKLTVGEKIGLGIDGYALKNPAKTGKDYMVQIKTQLDSMVSSKAITQKQADEYQKSSTLLALQNLSSDSVANPYDPVTKTFKVVYQSSSGDYIGTEFDINMVEKVSARSNLGQ